MKRLTLKKNVIHDCNNARLHVHPRARYAQDMKKNNLPDIQTIIYFFKKTNHPLLAATVPEKNVHQLKIIIFRFFIVLFCIDVP